MYEAGISRATAERVRADARPDRAARRATRATRSSAAAQGELYAFATLTGIYEANDPDADTWLGDLTPVRPVIRALSAEVQLLDAALLLADDAIAPLNDHMEASGRVLRYTWRSFLDPERLSDRTLDRTITGFRRLQVLYPSANITAANDIALRTGMLPILEGHRARWEAAASLVTVVALGPGARRDRDAGASSRSSPRAAAARRWRSPGRAARRGRRSSARSLVEGLLIALPAAAVAALRRDRARAAGRLADDRHRRRGRRRRDGRGRAGDGPAGRARARARRGTRRSGSWPA